MDYDIGYFERIELFLERNFCEEYLHFFDEFLNLLEEETISDLSPINHPVFSKWIRQKVSELYGKSTNPAPELGKILLSLTALVAKEEKGFCSLNTNNFFYKLVGISHIQKNALAYVALLGSFLKHPAGMDLILSGNCWKDVLAFGVEAQNGQMITKSVSFLSLMLQKATDQDELFCHGVIVCILEKLSDSISKIPLFTDLISPSEANLNNLKSIMKLIRKLLEDLLKLEKNDQLSLFFLKHFLDNGRFAKFMVVRNVKSLNFEYSALEFLVQFLQLYKSVSQKTIDLDKAKSASSGIMGNFYQHLRQESYQEVLKFCTFGQLYWKLFEERIYEPYLGSGEELQCFANAMSLIPALPFWHVICKFCPEKSDIFTDECIRDCYYEKIFKMCKLQSVRLYYWWRDRLNTENPYYFSFLGLKTIAESYKLFPKSRGVFLLQFLCYLLADTLDVLKTDSAIVLFDHKYKSRFFATTFNIIRLFITEFDITWQDGFETINILSLCFDFLKLDFWTKSVIVEILKLINTAITKYMAANLALLIDKVSDSTLALLGPILYSKVHDFDTKIRIAALNIIGTISHICSKDFVSLEEVIIETELPRLVVKMLDSKDDPLPIESLKCLQEMMTNSNIWHNHLAVYNINGKILNKLSEEESNKSLKIEAISFLSIAYEKQLISQQDLAKTFDTMRVISKNRDCEVRKHSLHFWQKVIERHLHIQGMEDNVFPKYIFSTKHKKIISLTHPEIGKRLLKVLEELNDIRCLTLLMRIIEDDCDFDVTQTAIEVLDTLLKLFLKYDFLKENFASGSWHNLTNTIPNFVGFCRQNFDQVLQDKKRYYKQSEEIFQFLNKMVPVEAID